MAGFIEETPWQCQISCTGQDMLIRRVNGALLKDFMFLNGSGKKYTLMKNSDRYLILVHSSNFHQCS